eukprot:766219-Hanusia_phi.AAC.2
MLPRCQKRPLQYWSGIASQSSARFRGSLVRDGLPGISRSTSSSLWRCDSQWRVLLPACTLLLGVLLPACTLLRVLLPTCTLLR